MQLLSALLSVTVLLAQAASGLRLQGQAAVLRLYFGYATVHGGIVGFHHGNKGDLVNISLEENRITTDFILQFREPEWYIFRSLKGITRSSLDLDAPFEVDYHPDRRRTYLEFKLKCHKDAKWFLCANSISQVSHIYLSVDGRARNEECMEIILYGPLGE